MKKININNEIGCELYFDFSGDFSKLGCNWILTTEGDPITDCDCDSEIDEAVDAIITNYECEDHCEPTVADFEYINGLINAWGI